jgi:isocitrate lyase
MKELIAALSQKLKIDEKQAQGGAAILFKATRDKLGSAEFSKMLGSVTGVESLVKQAPQSGGGLLGGLASLAGGNTALLATIVSGFSKLNLSTDQAQKFVPIMLDYLRNKVGPDVVERLEKTLRG